LAQEHYERVRDVVAAHYGNAIIPTLFKNLTKCRDIVQKCQEKSGIVMGEQQALPVIAGPSR